MYLHNFFPSYHDNPASNILNLNLLQFLQLQAVIAPLQNTVEH